MKKIMFNDLHGLTEAVLSGRKTQTRRIIPSNILCACDLTDNPPMIEDSNGDWHDLIKTSRYKVGEVVVVAQSYNDFYNDKCDPRQFPNGAGWTNKMFVRAELMPHQIRITNVRVERLQDISHEDCIKEGIVKAMVGSEDTHFMTAYYVPNIPSEPHILPQYAYAALIDRISRKGTWNSNPWVFVYDFELVK